MKNKEHTARQVIGYDKKLGKKVYNYNVPIDLTHLMKTFCSKCGETHSSKTLIGFGKWRNNKKKYICIAQKEELIFLEKDVIKEMWEYIKEEKKCIKHNQNTTNLKKNRTK